MTFKEKVCIEHPKELHYLSCPYIYGYEKKPNREHCKMSCKQCWNREIPEENTKYKMEEKKMEFNKSDLKDGMVVETRDGNRYFVFKDKFRSEDGYLRLYEYKENLLLKTREMNQFDIMKIFNPDAFWVFNDVLTKPGVLIWERKQTKEISVEEAAKLLKERFPEFSEVKIIV